MALLSCRIFFYFFVLSTTLQWATARSRHRAPFTPGWWYKLHDKDNTVCPMFEGNNAQIGLWDTCDDDLEHALWKVVRGSQNGTFTLVNEKTNLCMTVDIQDTGDNPPVIQYECQNPSPPSQLWSYDIVAGEDGNSAVLKNSDRCMTNHNPERGSAFYMFDCDGSKGQLMKI